MLTRFPAVPNLAWTADCFHPFLTALYSALVTQPAAFAGATTEIVRAIAIADRSRVAILNRFNVIPSGYGRARVGRVARVGLLGGQPLPSHRRDGNRRTVAAGGFAGRVSERMSARTTRRVRR